MNNSPFIKRFALVLTIIQCFVLAGISQGTISGSLETNANFFNRDTLIRASNTPQYDRQLFGAEAWLNLAYSNWGFDFGLRFDMYHNSNLLNPTASYSDQGIGRWYIKKNIHHLGIYAGYIYDQIGSGIIFRAYEERPLAIDNALYGLQLQYDLSPDWVVKAFTGRQKQQFDLYEPVIKGLSIDGFLSLGNTSPVTLAPGFGVVNRTLDDASMNSLVATINTYSVRDTFVPHWNTYAFSVFNTLTAGPISWYLEAAFKTKDAMNDPFGEFENNGTVTTGDKYISESGSVFYSSLSYAKKGLGITLEGKRTENFSFRTRPQEQLNRGMINFLPPMTRVNTFRLLSRYNAATQDLGELAFQADLRYALNRKWSINVNFSNITDLDDELLYREIFTEILYKYKNKWRMMAGLQRQEYNQEIYEFKPDVPMVETLTPYLEFLYKLDRRKSLRWELQYMLIGDDGDTKQDWGNWLFTLLEFSIAPKWSFTVSDMYNISPGKLSPVAENGDKKKSHFPRLDLYYTHKSNRFSISYVKQVEGVVCTGGICRFEPAFSGVKMTVNSSF